MAAKVGNGGRNGERSGARVLTLLATRISIPALRALAEGPKQQAVLRRSLGSPAETTLRAQLKRLIELGAIEKSRRNDFPGVLDYSLTSAGRDLLQVDDTLERWLGRAPGGALPLGTDAARAAIRALAEGWSTTMLRALVASPRSLTELDAVIDAVSYPSLERRLAALRLSGQVSSRAGSGRGTPYAVTDWAREGVGPIVAAASWEYRHSGGRSAPPIGRVEAETALLLALPLLRMPESASGSCRLGVELPGVNGRRLAGAVAYVENGRVESCTPRLQGKPDAWALGPPSAWLAALVKADLDRIERGGDGALSRALLEGLHRALFGAVGVPS